MLREGAFVVGVVCGLAPGAFDVGQSVTYAIYGCVKGDFCEGPSPLFDVFLDSGLGEDVPFPLGVFHSEASLALDVVGFN